jgi:hypothetical protein
MSATPTINVFRGGAITHLRVGSINYDASLRRRLAKKLETALKVSNHGFSTKNSFASIDNADASAGPGRQESDPGCYRLAPAGLEGSFSTRQACAGPAFFGGPPNLVAALKFPAGWPM